jgi:hypothetical protein
MKFKQAQKFRVIVGGISVYVTAKQIRWGFGDQLATNAAVYFAFNKLQDVAPHLGFCTRVGALDIQIDTL